MRSKALSIIVLAALSGGVVAQGEAKKRSLYERLGGVHAIAAVVDDFVDRLGKNEVIGANKKSVDALMKIGIPGIKFRVTQFVCHIAGGPQKYTGRDMKAAHAGLGISESEWQASAMDFKAALDKFKVGDDLQGELFKAIGDMKKDIVTAEGERTEAMADAKPETLYSRLGGVNAIAAVVDEFVNRLASDSTVGGNPHVVKSLTSGKVSAAGLKYLVTEQLCEASGGPQKYSGRSMKDSHKGLMITEKEWEAGGRLLKETLDHFKVPEKEQKEVIAAVLATRKDIVGH